MSNYPPILEVPTSSSFRDLQETEVELLFPTGKEFTDKKYGYTKYRWSVKVNGVEHSLFATETLNKKMLDHRPDKGTRLSIARVGTGKETRWDVVYVSGPQGADVPQSTSPSQPVARTTGPNPTAFKSDLDLYIKSLKIAHGIAQDNEYPFSVDLNAIGFVVYKMAKDHGIADPSAPDAPANSGPNTTQQAEAQGKSKMRQELEILFKETGLHETQIINVLRVFANDATFQGWDDVTRDMGLAIYAAGQSIKQGQGSWNDYLGGDDEFPPDSELPF